MSAHKLNLWWLLIMVVVLLAASAAHADFVLVENFESLELDSIDDQSDWTAPSDSSTVTLDPVGGVNQVLSVITESTYLYKPVSLLDDTIRMFFLRFRIDGQLNFSLGMSDVSHPSRFDHFEAELSLTNSTSELRINDGGTYNILSVLQQDTWYNCWLLIDNINDETQVWLHERPGQAATSADQLDSEGQVIFQFRNVSAGDMQNFFIKTGGGSGPGGPLYIDDIYLENTSTLNLGNPTTMPTAVRSLEVPQAYSLAPNYPNPFNPHTSIAFALADQQPVQLAVYNLDGRQVAVLVDEVLPAGRHEIVWNGCDLQGRPLASGTYFYRITAGSFKESRVMTLLK